MVVMSIAQYEKQQALLELYKKLGVAEKEMDYFDLDQVKVLF